MTIRRLAALLCLTSSSWACSNAPTSPGTPPVAPAVSSYAGTWSLEMTITDCSGLRHCWTRIGGPMSGWMRLVESGAALEGVLSLGYGTVDVTGNVAPDGRVALRGFTPPAFADDPGGSELELRSFAASLSEGGEAGTIEFRQRGEFASGVISDYVIKARILRVNRIAEAPAGLSFTGTWTGRLAIRSCRANPPFVGFVACDPEEPNRTHPIELSLTQSGNMVTGLVRLSSRDIPVSGRIDGQGVTLTGVLEEGRPATAITRWAATIDKLGRMRGTFSYVTSYSSREFAYDIVELWSMVLRP